jgi:hypothetical protein
MQAPLINYAALQQSAEPNIKSDPSNDDIALPHSSTDPVRALVADGKLVLLVNLEGTLIDVAKPSSVEKWPPEQQHQLQLTVSAQSPSDTSLLQLPVSLLWIKMRPGWQQCMYRLACFYTLRLVCLLRPICHLYVHICSVAPVQLSCLIRLCNRTAVALPEDA